MSSPNPKNKHIINHKLTKWLCEPNLQGNILAECYVSNNSQMVEFKDIGNTHEALQVVCNLDGEWIASQNDSFFFYWCGYLPKTLAKSAPSFTRGSSG